MKRVWDIREVDHLQAESLADALSVSPLLASLLIQRGVSDADAARRFLDPSLKDLYDPFTMRDMDRVVARIVTALKAGEKVCIWGDYDVDGITSTSVLKLFLQSLGLLVDYHIPSRLEEGYGLNTEAIARIHKEGVSLLITVDCGISDLEQVAFAKGLGMDVIVLDHHQVGEEMPDAVAVLNPHRSDCTFPAKNMAAVGVSFNLVMALRAELRDRGVFDGGREPNLRELLDLVALGTVADIVPLVDENRVLAYFGLTELSAGRRPGVAALKEVAGILGGEVSSGQVAYRLAPRINAAGRLGQASMGVELLTTRSYSTALNLARELDQANVKRQGIEQKIFKAALEQAELQRQRGRHRALVLASDEWHVGVIGIVASRLVERFGCPVVLVSFDGEEGRGSARGVEGVHLYQAMAQCSEHLTGFGGHRLAAGLTLRRDALETFRDDFHAAIRGQLVDEENKKTYRVDAEAQPGVWTDAQVASLAAMAPHGLGNPEPIFVGRHLTVRSIRSVGREPPYHLKATVVDDGKTWDLIGFRLAERIPEFQGPMDLLYTPEFNTWDGQTSVQLRLIDARPSR